MLERNGEFFLRHYDDKDITSVIISLYFQQFSMLIVRQKRYCIKTIIRCDIIYCVHVWITLCHKNNRLTSLNFHRRADICVSSISVLKLTISFSQHRQSIIPRCSLVIIQVSIPRTTAGEFINSATVL